MKSIKAFTILAIFIASAFTIGCKEDVLVKVEKNKSRVIVGIKSLNKFATYSAKNRKISDEVFVRLNDRLQWGLDVVEKISTENLTVDADGRVLKNGLPFDPTAEMFEVVDSLIKTSSLISDDETRNQVRAMITTIESSVMTIKILLK